MLDVCTGDDGNSSVGLNSPLRMCLSRLPLQDKSRPGVELFKILLMLHAEDFSYFPFQLALQKFCDYLWFNYWLLRQPSLKKLLNVAGSKIFAGIA